MAQANPASEAEMAAITAELARRRKVAVRSTVANGMAVMLGYMAVYASTLFSVLLVFGVSPLNASLFGGTLGVTIGLSKATKSYAKAQ